MKFLRWVFQSICLVSFPFIGLGIGTYVGMWLKEDEINGIDLGVIPTLAGFVFGAWVAYKIFLARTGATGVEWIGIKSTCY